MNLMAIKVLVGLGIAATLFTGMLAARMVWEETSLTWQQGPQMLGFSLAHGAGAVLFLAPILLSLWILVALIVLVVCLLRKRKIPGSYWRLQ
jgi:NO-binding membrane sensor protein with MHYT domain